MEPHRPEMLPHSSVAPNSGKPKPNSTTQNPGEPSEESRVPGQATAVVKKQGSIGTLEVFIHQARDIHNICIYHKQDVYAKISLTSDPETTVSTQIINGGGRNPVFNESLKLKVNTIGSSLKCEIWMLSRVRNYLEDQLLGFALVPLSDVVTEDAKLEKEFSLSSSDLFHSPAGFVQLTLSYTGASPEVFEISTPRSSAAANPASDPNELDKIEFPDPKIVNENELMVSEYFGIPPADYDSANPERLSSVENGEHLSSEDTTVEIAEGLPTGGIDGAEVSKTETPPVTVSTTVSPLAAVPASPPSASNTPGASKQLKEDSVSSSKEKKEDASEAESGSSALPVINVNIEPEQKVVQQDIVDMYMKSMQQFTESLAKMKLPLDIDNGPANSDDTKSDEKVQAPKSNGRSPKVFYGSRAFF